MQKGISASEFYHDRALDCFMKLATENDRTLYHTLRCLINVKEMSLCEAYWTVIAQNADVPEYRHMHLHRLLHDHFMLYNESESIRVAHAKCMHLVTDKQQSYLRHFCIILAKAKNT